MPTAPNGGPTDPPDPSLLPLSAETERATDCVICRTAVAASRMRDHESVRHGRVCVDCCLLLGPGPVPAGGGSAPAAAVAGPILAPLGEPLAPSTPPPSTPPELAPVPRGAREPPHLDRKHARGTGSPASPAADRGAPRPLALRVAIAPPAGARILASAAPAPRPRTRSATPAGRRAAGSSGTPPDGTDATASFSRRATRGATSRSPAGRKRGERGLRATIALERFFVRKCADHAHRTKRETILACQRAHGGCCYRSLRVCGAVLGDDPAGALDPRMASALVNHGRVRELFCPGPSWAGSVVQRSCRGERVEAWLASSELLSPRAAPDDPEASA
jgi:hypothetical protein